MGVGTGARVGVAATAGLGGVRDAALTGWAGSSLRASTNAGWGAGGPATKAAAVGTGPEATGAGSAGPTPALLAVLAPLVPVVALNGRSIRANRSTSGVGERGHNKKASPVNAAPRPAQATTSRVRAPARTAGGTAAATGMSAEGPTVSPSPVSSRRH